MTVHLADEEIARLTDSLNGPVFLPGDPGYAEECATFNLMSPLEPMLAVGATSVADVQAAIRFAARRGLAVAVRGGGHLVARPAGDALLINVRRMAAVEVDVADSTVRIEGGALWAQVLDAVTPYGLAPMNGSTSTVGAIGYLLGGGHSPTLARRYGYASDHVSAIEMVTADGEFRIVTGQSDSDLFFALRGGKGNFGVVTAVTVAVFPVSRIYAGGLYFPGEHVADVLHAWREWLTGIPLEVTSSVAIQRLPALPDIPEPIRGAFVVHVRIAFLGDGAAGRRLIEPLRDCAPLVIDSVHERAYSDARSIHADPTHPLPYLDRSTGLRELTKETVDALVELVGPASGCELISVEIRALGGNLDRAPAYPDAVPTRNVPFQLFAFGLGGPTSSRASREGLTTLIRGVEPWADQRSMVNFLSPDEAGTAGQVRATYGDKIYDRLADVKARYDPANLFRINHNIAPADSGPGLGG